MKKLGQPDEAIAAYRRAVYALQSIRAELTSAYGATPQSFRESIGPVYFELADLLLQRAASPAGQEQAEKYLREARDAVELFKVGELRDYFRDDCVDAAKSRVKGLEIVSKTSAVIYPILLPDRIELLVSFPKGLKRFVAPVSAERLTQEVRAFRELLEKRTTLEFLTHAQQIYDWLIRPLEPALVESSIDTLVIVPDGPLRTIPVSALHDGKDYLINKFAVATTPSLTLTDPRPLKRETIVALSVGLTVAVQGLSPGTAGPQRVRDRRGGRSSGPRTRRGGDQGRSHKRRGNPVVYQRPSIDEVGIGVLPSTAEPLAVQSCGPSARAIDDAGRSGLLSPCILGGISLAQ